MAEKPPEITAKKSLAARLGLSDEPGKAAPYLRALLAFVTEMPGVGPVLKGTSAALKELSDEEDDQKLERRLFALGEQTRDDIAALAELARVIFLQHNALLERLEAQGFRAEQRQLSEFALGAALLAYRSRVARDYQYADHRGIEGGTRTAHVASLALDDTYVIPRLFPERDRASISDREKDILKSLLDNRDLAFDRRCLLEEEYALITGERWHPGAKAQAEGLPLGKALAQARHAVVIGSPGVGKSALTRYLARTCALGEEAMQERLAWAEYLTPIIVSLASLADAREGNADLALRDFLDAKMTERGGEALRAAITEELANGRIFMMLDGVDEVPDSHARASIVQAVDVFIAEHTANRFLVTSRPYGYTRVAGDIAHFQMPNFTPEQVEDFMRRWQRATEFKQHPEAPDLDHAKTEADAILAEIRRNPKVTELATNPLMLVIISLIRYERTRLPEERVQLYNRAINTLMDTWNQWRSAPGKDVGGMLLPLNQLIPVWGSVAEWMRRNKPTGVVHRAELKREIVRILREKELDEDDPEATAESYLNAAARRAGLLEERGPDIFAFWHPTFEEYLAAVELTTPASKAVRSLLPLRNDPRWREVILLAVGHVGIVQHDSETATEIVRAIAEDEPDVLEPILHGHLRLAAACIADDVGVKRTLAQRVIVRLAEIIQRQPYVILIDTFVNTIQALPRLRPSAETVSSLTPVATHKSWEVRMEATRMFSNVAAEQAEALSLCKRLLNDSISNVSCHAALGLARAGDYRPEVWQKLASFENSTAHIENAAREFFLTLPGEAISSLIQGLSADDFNLRYEAADMLQKLERADEKVVDALMPLLNADDFNHRLQAADVLQKMGRVDETVIHMLMPLLNTDDFDLRYRAACMLQLTGRANEQIAKALIPSLGSDNMYHLGSATQLLQWMAQADENVIDALIPLLNADDFNQRLQTTLVLHGLGRADEKVVEVLTSFLNSDDFDQRFRAAYQLQIIGQADEKVIEALTSFLSADDFDQQFLAALVLQNVERANEQVANALMTCLSADDFALRYETVGMLQKLGRTDERIADALMPLLNSDNFYQRVQAADMLQTLGREAIVVETMIRTICPQPWIVMAACQRVMERRPLSDDDGRALAELMRLQPDDSKEKQKAREWLFNWILKKIETRGKTAEKIFLFQMLT